MTSTRAIAVLLVLCLAGTISTAVAQDPAPADAEATAAANEWRTQLIAGDAAKLWELASEETHRRMADDLAELKERMRTVPADRLDNTIDGLSVSARKILEIKDGKAFFTWLVSRISAAERKTIEKVTVDTVEVDGDAATVSWKSSPDAELTASAMPTRLTRTDGKWRIEVEE